MSLRLGFATVPYLAVPDLLGDGIDRALPRDVPRIATCVDFRTFPKRRTGVPPVFYATRT